MSEVGGTCQGELPAEARPAPQAPGAGEGVPGRRGHAGRLGIGTLRWLLVGVLVVTGARKLLDAPAVRIPVW
jgi:hypothetical protein